MRKVFGLLAALALFPAHGAFAQAAVTVLPGGCGTGNAGNGVVTSGPSGGNLAQTGRGQNTMYVDTAGNLCTTVGSASTANVNLQKVNGTTTSVNNGTTDAGTLRVTISSDSTGTVTQSPTPTAASANAIAGTVVSAAGSSLVLKASAGNLYDAYVTTAATALYFMVFNATSAPVDGAVTPVHCVYVPANTTQSLFVGGGPPESYSTGITVVTSSTGCFTKTASNAAFIHGRVK